MDKEGKHPIVDVMKARPNSDFLETGIDLSRIRNTLKDLMHHDDAEEIIAKSADTTLNIIGAGHIDKGENPQTRILSSNLFRIPKIIR